MPTYKSFPSNGTSISADWYEPSSAPYPVVVVDYGTEGMNSPFDKLINDYCLGLRQEGFAVLRPDYFQSTSTKPGMNGVFISGPSNRFDVWVEVIVDAARYAMGLPQVTGKLGMVGFSLGANLVLRAAAKNTPKPDAVVDFFGPIESIEQSPFSSALASKLPPVQIHHGSNDEVVLFQESTKLERWLTVTGVSFEFDHRAYVGSGHPGQKMLPLPSKADWSPTDERNSLVSSVTFLKKYL